MKTNHKSTPTQLTWQLVLTGVIALGLFVSTSCASRTEAKEAGVAITASNYPPLVTASMETQTSSIGRIGPAESHADHSVPLTTDPKIVRLEQKWGIEIVALRLASAGHMIDFRFKVIDPDKAAPLLARRAKPYLEDEASGIRVIVPVSGKVGALRQDTMKPIPNKIYFSFFANPGKIVKTGSKVTIVIDNFKVEHLVVQ